MKRLGPTARADAQAAHDETNTKGSEYFGTLWLGATSVTVAAFREMGFGEDVERDPQLRAAISRGLFRALIVATRHPNNLARGAKKLKEKP